MKRERSEHIRKQGDAIYIGSKKYYLNKNKDERNISYIKYNMIIN